MSQTPWAVVDGLEVKESSVMREITNGVAKMFKVTRTFILIKREKECLDS